jgi:hypothetical protein
MSTTTDTKTAAAPSLDVAAVTPAPVPMAAPIANQVQESAGMQLLNKAIERGASIEELDRLIDLAERLRAIAAHQAFTRAMVQFKRNPPTIEKTRQAKVDSKKGEGASFAYKYANLADVCRGIIQQLAELGITHKHAFKQEGSAITVRCTLTHELGHTDSAELTAHIDTSGGKNSLQGLGSATTYLERYTLLGVCGLALDDEQDDDGQAGITGDERAELRQAAGELRNGRGQRQSPQQVAGRDDKAPPPEGLLEQARKAADKGHKEFGPYWRNLTEAQRGQLMPEMANLTERAGAATAQLATEDGAK